MTLATVSAKGQVVIPAEIRRRLGIGPGTELEFVEEGGQIRVLVLRAVTASRLEDGLGMLSYAGPPRRLGDFDAADELRKQQGGR